MQPTALIHARQQHQLLTFTGAASPSDVVSRLCAVQAQDFAAGKWAIGGRIPGATDKDIEAAIARKEMVRSWSLRGTLHFMAAQDIRWILPLAASRLSSLYGSYYRKLELEGEPLRRCYHLFTKAMEGGKQLTRPELKALLERNGQPTADMRLNFLLVKAALEGLICLGTRRGKAATYTLLEEWLPGAPTGMGPEEARARLAQRYFTGHGPATLPDFVWWSGLTVAEARNAVAAAQPELHPITWQGQTYWTGDAAPTGKLRKVLLLPSFDEYLVGYKDRSLVLDPQYYHRVMGTGNGLFSPVVVTNGQVTGTWRRTFAGKSATVTLSPFTSWSPGETVAIRAAAQDFGRFLELPVTVINAEP